MAYENDDKQGVEKSKTMLAGFILLLLAAALLTYGNYEFARQQPGGADFLHRWLPIRSMLFDGNPDVYSEETSLLIQMARYGRPAEPGEVPGLFAYPLYVIVFIFPFALIEDFVIARSLWTTLLELSHIGIVLLSLYLTGFKPGKFTFSLLMIFSLFVSFFTQALGNGNPAGLAVLLVLTSLAMIGKNKDWLAGTSLAMATFKPQLVILAIAMIGLWAIGKKRWGIILSATVTLGLLFALSFLLQPTWLSGFIRQVLFYPEVASSPTAESVLSRWVPALARWISYLLMAGSLGLLVREGMRLFNRGENTLFWVTCLSFTLLPFTGLSSAKWNFIGMLPGMIVIVAAMTAGADGKSWLADSILVITIVLSWVAKRIELQGASQGMNLLFFDTLPIALLMTLGLYTVKKDATGEEDTARAVDGEITQS